MRFAAFVLKHLRQAPIRTASTVVAMALCVFLFCTLQSVLAQFDRVLEGRSPRRLITTAALEGFLPVSQAERIRTVPGVKRVAIMTLFGGLLPARKEGKAEAGSGSATDWSNVFQTVAVDAEPYFAMNPELMIPPYQFREFMKDLQGCLVGRELADKFGWKLGDRFFLESFIPGLRKPSGPFEFVVRGFIDTDRARYPGAETNLMYFHYRYLDVGLGGINSTWMFAVEIEDADQSAEIGSAIDAVFENSSDPTHTQTEREFTAGIMSLAGNLSTLLNGIGLAVSFTILLVTANTMSMAVRERRTEIAVLKTLGFTGSQVLGLIVAEALLLGALGGALGIGGTVGGLWLANRLPGTTLVGLSTVELRPLVALTGLAMAVLVGLAAGFAPAWGAYRARVTDMLRTV